jgi:DNA-directed RNA polymerase specialized sigma24 family protein
MRIHTADAARREKNVRRQGDTSPTAARAQSQDDPAFVGVRSEVRQLFDGVADQLGSGITAPQRQAAELFAETLDCAAVDATLDLPLGTTKGWAQDDDFMSVAAYARATREKYRTLEVDAGRALNPAQREAARLLVIDHLTQTDVAAAVGKDRRTIYNWLRRPTFRQYMDQVEEKEQSKCRARLAAIRREMLQELEELRAIVVRNAKRHAEEGVEEVEAQVLRAVLAKF